MSGRAFVRNCAGVWRIARNFRRDITGVAAVEFGFIAPVMLVMLIGTIEISRAVSMDRKFGLVTAMVGDLVAREKTMSSANLNAIYDIVEHAMRPYDTSTLKIAVVPVKADSSDETNTKVYAGITNRPSFQGASAPAACSPYTLTSGLVDKGASVIVVESSYEFEPLLTGVILGSSTWTDKAILSPRNSCVDFDSDNCVSSCF